MSGDRAPRLLSPGEAAARQYRHEANHHRQAIALIPTDAPEGGEARRRWWHGLAVELLEAAAESEAPRVPRPGVPARDRSDAR